jgi:hypothetical protein
MNIPCALNLHGNHLHVSALQILVKLVLLRFDDHTFWVTTILPIVFVLCETWLIAWRMLLAIVVVRIHRGGENERRKPLELRKQLCAPSLKRSSTHKLRRKYHATTTDQR